jgi:parvulin-like peptidyl-prolyl isomerase
LEIIKSTRSSNRKTPSILLALGAIAGILLAAFGLLESSRFSSNDGVAQVNQTVIKQDTYQRLLAALQSDKRSPLTEDDRRLVLDRLVDEELLVQRGVELGFLELNSTVRNTLIQAVTTAVISGSELSAPTESELQLFYQEHHSLFTQPPRLHLQQLVITNNDKMAHERADAIMQKLQSGVPFSEVKAAHGDAIIFDIPELPLPTGKLREYIGPTLLEVASNMTPGDFSEPTAVQDKLIIIRLVSRTDAITPPLSSIRRQVEAEYQRNIAATTFRDYVQWLRNRADISTPEESR